MIIDYYREIAQSVEFNDKNEEIIYKPATLFQVIQVVSLLIYNLYKFQALL